MKNIFFFYSIFRCCKVCAKVLGEACGGPGDFSGACEPPLNCVTKPPIIGNGVCLGKNTIVSHDKPDMLIVYY
jgi:hypothetical protein